MEHLLRKELNSFLVGDEILLDDVLKGEIVKISDRVCTAAIIDSTDFQKGDTVFIHGLTSELGTHLNRKLGCILEIGSERAIVELDTKVKKSFKFENLRTVTDRVLLRDCKIVSPTGWFVIDVRQEGEAECLSWRGSGSLTCDGRGRLRNGNHDVAVLDIGRCGHSHIMRVADGYFPTASTVYELTVSISGMDQGWGNTGEAGVVIYCTDDNSTSNPWDRAEPLCKVLFNRNVSSSRNHVFTLSVPHSVPQYIIAALACPPYGGWSATVESVTMTAKYFTVSKEAIPRDPISLHQEIQWKDVVSFLKDNELQVDTSHMSLEGQEMQHVWNRHESTEDRGPISPRYPHPNKLFLKLDNNTPAGGAPQDEAERRDRYNGLRNIIHEIFDIMEKSFHLEIVCQQFEECASECLYRWEREIFNMFDLVSGDITGVDSMTAEDLVLRKLCEARRRMSETCLHRLKGTIENSDMHFETYFYGSISFGLPEEIDARKDVNRLNYAVLNFFDPKVVREELYAQYSPQFIRNEIRRGIFDSNEKGTQQIREKIMDFLRQAIPASFKPNESDRLENWIYQECFDEQYRITDDGLNYLLCVMHILSPVFRVPPIEEQPRNCILH